MWSLAFWSPRVYPTAALLCIRPDGGRTWWAHLAFTRTDIALTTPQNQVEEQLVLGASGFDPRSFCLWKCQDTDGASCARRCVYGFGVIASHAVGYNP